MFFQYLQDRCKAGILLLLSGLIFTTVFYLYALPVNAVLYAGLLCFILLFFTAVFDYFYYSRKRRTLSSYKGNIINGFSNLPPGNGIELDYQNLLYEFEEAYKKLTSQNDADRMEMTDFYTLWVHQIKTPIAAMRMLLQENDSDENPQLLQELFKIERYAELVLGYLRIEDISSDLSLNPYSLEHIIRQSVKKYAPMFIHKKIKLNLYNLDTTVLTDAKWMTFVVEQLLSNALKYTSKGSIKIYMEPEKTLVIEDTGIGISPEDLPRIFEKGFTGFNGRMDKKSTGLGLYLCKKTLAKLHHKISITSRQGEGTTVKLNLSSAETCIE